MPRLPLLRPTSLRLALVAGLLAAATASPAGAQTRRWDFGDRTAPGACTQSAAGSTVGTATGIENVFTCTEQPGSPIATLRLTAFNAGTAATSVFATGAVTPQGTTNGVGVGSRAERGLASGSGNGEHALDNNGTGGADALLLHFLNGPEAITRVTIGWSGTDADFQLLRWTGAAAPTLAGSTVSGALAAGWQLVAAVNGAANIGEPDAHYAVNGGRVASSHWLLSAYNPALGALPGFTADATADRFKVRGVTVTTPEPSTYALMAAGVAALAAAARRRRA